MCNVYEVIARHYDLNLDEIFTITNSEAHECVVKLCNDGLYRILFGQWVPAPPVLLTEILDGKWEIHKLPFKPKKGDTYFYIYLINSGYCVTKEIWDDQPIDYAREKEYGVYENYTGVFRKATELQEELKKYMEVRN